MSGKRKAPTTPTVDVSSLIPAIEEGDLNVKHVKVFPVVDSCPDLYKRFLYNLSENIEIEAYLTDAAPKVITESVIGSSWMMY